MDIARFAFSRGLRRGIYALHIFILGVLAIISTYLGVSEVATGTIGGIIALGMKVLENSDNA